MTEELTLSVTDLEKKAIAFCREKDVPYPIANYLVEFANELTKELQEDLEHKKIAVQKRKARIKELESQLEKSKEILKRFVKWFDYISESENWKSIVDDTRKLLEDK